MTIKDINIPIKVPYGMNVYGEAEISAVVDTMRHSTQMGGNVRRFEAFIAKSFAKQYGIMVNSGSSANYLAVELANLPNGAEVITPVLTFATTVAPLIKNGLVPAFVDSEEGTYNIDVTKIESMITKNTKAIMVPNLIGNLPDWPMIKEIATRHNLIIIEDSADTLGAELEGHPSGYFSDISTTSFYGSHIINCAGNGGMLCINDDKMAENAKLLRSWGRRSSLFIESESIDNRFNISLDGIDYDAKFVFDSIGYNLEPSEIGAAFGLVQFEKLNDYIAMRIQNFTDNYNFFRKYEEFFILPKPRKNAKLAWLAFPLTIKKSAPFDRKTLQIFLEQNNIQTRPVFTGNILRQPMMKNISYKGDIKHYKNADNVMAGGILLALHQGLTHEMKNHLYTTFERFIKSYAG